MGEAQKQESPGGWRRGRVGVSLRMEKLQEGSRSYFKGQSKNTGPCVEDSGGLGKINCAVTNFVAKRMNLGGGGQGYWERGRVQRGGQSR